MDTIDIARFEEFEVPEMNKNLLCHFTSAKSFFSILRSMSLKTSPFENLNDLNEGNVFNHDIGDTCLSIDVQSYINSQCRILSFTHSNDSQELVNHPSMWAHYADNCKGVCIIIDKERFVEENKDIIDTHFCKFEEIKYGFANVANDSNYENNVIIAKEYVFRNYKPLFFLKHNDWQSENEYRLLVTEYVGVFSILRSIKHIVLGKRFKEDEENMCCLQDILSNPQNACHKRVCKESFGMVSSDRYGYIALSTQHLFEQRIINKKI